MDDKEKKEDSKDQQESKTTAGESQITAEQQTKPVVGRKSLSSIKADLGPLKKSQIELQRYRELELQRYREVVERLSKLFEWPSVERDWGSTPL